MRITVVGSGYVGLVTAACFAELGHHVICTDKDSAKIEALRRGHCIIHEQYLPELLHRNFGERLQFGTDLQRAASQSEVVFIAVGTPSLPSGALDVSQVESVARELGSICIDGYRLIICKSTVPAGSTEWIHRVLLLNGAAPADFDVVFNPEFLREGTAVTDFLFPDRIIVGASNIRAQQVLADLYQPLVDGSYARREGRIGGIAKAAPKFLVTSPISAEIVKEASNSFLAMKVSFINAVAALCERSGADIEEVKAGIGSDSRIGNRFLNAGLGYGGSCFPKDVRAFQEMARNYGVELTLLNGISEVNDNQRVLFIDKVREALWNLSGKRVGTLGLAYKGGTDDIRESPAIAVIRELLKEGSSIIAYDPAANERSRTVLKGEQVEFVSDPYLAANGADALLILTDWKEFANLNLSRIRDLLRYPILVDGRNLYSPARVAEAGLYYHSIGRKPGIPSESNRKRALEARDPSAAALECRQSEGSA